METLTTEWLPRSDSPVREAKTGISSVSPAYRGIKMEWLCWPLTDGRSKNEYPAKPRGGVRGLQMTGAEIRFQLSHAKTTNEIQICFSITSHTKTKFKSVFQSNAKTRNEIHIRFSKWYENEKRNTKFKSVFQSLGENEKQKAKFKSVFQCHAKTKNRNGTWIPFSHAIEKRLALKYTHYPAFLRTEFRVGAVPWPLLDCFTK